MRMLAFDITPMPEWPAEDRLAWQLAIVGGGLFDAHGPLAHYGPGRLHCLVRAYGRWLGFLRYALDDEFSGSGLTYAEAPVLVARFCRELDTVAPCTARGYLTDLLTACRGLHPDAGFTALHRAMRHSWRTARPITNKLAKMVPARDLWQLGLVLMHEAASLPTSLKQATRYRDGLMVAMLICAPARISSFVRIRLGEQLAWDGTRYRICFRPDEVKTRRYLEYPLPVDLNEAIRGWLEVYRPVCLAQRGRWHREHARDSFWISNSGAPFARVSVVRDRIERITEERLGRRINPHLFRDCAATSIASEIPEDVGIIRNVLGHTSLDAGMRYYNQARSIGAARALQSVLAGFRTPTAAEERSI